jgi:hypothetical protein
MEALILESQQQNWIAFSLNIVSLFCREFNDSRNVQVVLVFYRFFATGQILPFRQLWLKSPREPREPTGRINISRQIFPFRWMQIVKPPGFGRDRNVTGQIWPTRQLRQKKTFLKRWLDRMRKVQGEKFSSVGSDSFFIFRVLLGALRIS